MNCEPGIDHDLACVCLLYMGLMALDVFGCVLADTQYLPGSRQDHIVSSYVNFKVANSQY